LGAELRQRLAADIDVVLAIANDSHLMADLPWIAESIQALEGLFLMCWGPCREQTRVRGATSPVTQDGCSQVKLDPCRKDSEKDPEGS